MAKTKEELETLKKEYQDLTNKLSDLSEDELKEIASGASDEVLATITCPLCHKKWNEYVNKFFSSDVICPNCREHVIYRP